MMLIACGCFIMGYMIVALIYGICKVASKK